MKQVDVLEPNDDGRDSELTADDCLNLVKVLLKSRNLSQQDRQQLEILKADLASEELAKGVTDFLRPFLDEDMMVKMIIDALGEYVRLNH